MLVVAGLMTVNHYNRQDLSCSESHEPPYVGFFSPLLTCPYTVHSHCPWVGNCIGERNHRYFFVFLFAISGMTMVTTIASFRVLIQAYLDMDTAPDNFHRLLDAIISMKLTMLFGSFTLLCAWSLTSLLCFHAMIISIAQTTNEKVRNVYRHDNNNNTCLSCGASSDTTTSMTGADNEADHGCCVNWYQAFCKPIPLSRLPPDMSANVVCDYETLRGPETPWTGETLVDEAKS